MSEKTAKEKKSEAWKKWKKRNPGYEKQYFYGEEGSVKPRKTYAGRPVLTPEERRNRREKRKGSRRELNVARLREYKETRPCADCQKFYPYYVMHCDHLRDKIDNVSRLVIRVAWDKIAEELAKCDIVCANCHAERTQQRRK